MEEICDQVTLLMKLHLDSLSQIYFCTGARNVELLNYFAKDRLKFEFDERMASFKALGLSKILGPVAVCTTSGTAVSECLSAMLEAYYSKLPLVLITGDRPKKQHGTGAPQTINHEALTRATRGSYFEIHLHELKTFELENPVYPVHINVLVDDTKEHNGMVVNRSSLSSFEDFLRIHKRPLFLFSHEESSMRTFVQEFCKLGIPFYAETMSGAHDLSPIKSEKELISLFKQGKFDSVVRVGFTPLSKVWRLLETQFTPVSSFDSRNLPALSYGDVYPLSAQALLQDPYWWEMLKQISCSLERSSAAEDLKALAVKFPKAEVSTFMQLQKALPEKSIIYLGNSLIIRHFELTQEKNFEIHGNRGVNGIDGQLATAIGIATAVKENVYCILGDITTMYDLSSLREMPSNLKLIIINNQGGRIFDVLKLDKRIVLEHDFCFRNICEGMNLSYAQNSLESLSQVQVLELNPDRKESEAFWQEWIR